MLDKHKAFWLDRLFVYNVLLSLALLGAAFFANHYADYYTTTHASNFVTDIVLDNIPVVDVHLIFSEGALLFILFLIIILLHEPQYIPFTVKSISVFIFVRSFFLVLTHIAAPPHAIFIDPTDYIARVSSGDDLFFSAHTGLPFLLAFVFWNKRLLRYIFFACSIVGGAAVLLGHLHYSIDVFSALFIAFGIFHICKNLFPKDFQFAGLS